MNKNRLVISSIVVVLSATAHAFAEPVPTAIQSSGVLGSPVAQLPVQDPVILQAIEWIKSKQTQQQAPKLQRKPETVISGSQNQADRHLILGGPEVVPM